MNKSLQEKRDEFLKWKSISKFIPECKPITQSENKSEFSTPICR